MKKHNLIVASLIFVSGAVVGHFCSNKLLKTEHCCKKSNTCCSTNDSKITANDPVYIRETKTNGEGL
ncbi:MAG: hypothetical protein ABGA11_08800 [Liquorilactobacillus hordei]|uniref:Uncharacterized protein n=1 Tax=Liquorilactobacillus hordei TaxID=468911 RepID=A0A3Q8CB86_9LACO|nr:hypothetical protein [Liquorilactobacillus hordei]AUJ29103.1 hypothetical protein BSQ49_02090 [Liquorilactobacillus hordei]QYH51807.1 hypothetical protein G6O70_04695 [Liquorilactobacillus hordei DSM 19519]